MKTLAYKAIYKLYERITHDIKLMQPLKVVVDCGNGIAGNVTPQLLKKLNCKVIEFFYKVGGNFPNHHPEPRNLHDLIDIVHT